MNPSNPLPQWQVYRNLLRGSAWGLLSRWGIRFIGFFSVIVLARLLEPADFGLVALGTAAIGLLSNFSELGAHNLLIRTRSDDRAHADTAWTIKVIQGVFVALVLAACAPLLARFFSEPRLAAILYVVAMSAIIAGFSNIGVVLARKELDFALDFRFHVYEKLVGAVATVGLAFLLRSYWSLVLGHLVGVISALIVSYGIHSYRPRWSLAKLREYLTFGASVIPMNLSNYVYQQFGTVLIGRTGTTTDVGPYSIAANVSGMATSELVAPVLRGLLPSYAKLTDNRAQLITVYLEVLTAVTTILFPVGIGLSLVADAFVVTIYGPKWAVAGPLLQWLALGATLGTLTNYLGGQILVITGYERRVAALWIARVVLLVVSALVGQAHAGVEGIALGVAVANLVAVPLGVFTLWKTIGITAFQVMRAIARPLFACSVMAGGLLLLDMPAGTSAPVVLLGQVAIGACLYTGTLLASWFLTGRPRGLESLVAGFITRPRRGRPPGG